MSLCRTGTRAIASSCSHICKSFVFNTNLAWQTGPFLAARA